MYMLFSNYTYWSLKEIAHPSLKPGVSGLAASLDKRQLSSPT